MTTAQQYSPDVEQVSNVWSSYGHRFMSTDEPTHEVCLTCGAMYQFLAHADDLTTGAYLTNCGDEPQRCTGDTGMAHGYPGERVCSGGEDEHGNCTSCQHNCNCLLCDS